MAMRRIQKELRDASMNHANDFSVTVVDNDMFHWEGKLIGEIETPYENGSFYVDIKFPFDYPSRVPTVYFKTKIYHPNVGDNGFIGLEILCPRGWNVSKTIIDVLLDIKSVLKEPYVCDSYNPTIGNQYKDDYEEFFRTAREWTEIYAT